MNRDEVIWAAGLFDGEGTIFASIHNRPDRFRLRYTRLHIALSMTTPDVVRRFHAAVGGIGTCVKLPPGGENRKPQLRWQATNFEAAQAAFAMLWPFLSDPKRQQGAVAMGAMRVWFARDRSRPHLRKSVCLRGHDLSLTRYVAPGGGSYCRECVRERRDAPLFNTETEVLALRGPEAEVQHFNETDVGVTKPTPSPARFGRTRNERD